MDAESDDLLTRDDWQALLRHVAERRRLALRAEGRVDGIISLPILTA